LSSFDFCGGCLFFYFLEVCKIQFYILCFPKSLDQLWFDFDSRNPIFLFSSSGFILTDVR
jgi:hypothetical protein